MFCLRKPCKNICFSIDISSGIAVCLSKYNMARYLKNLLNIMSATKNCRFCYLDNNQYSTCSLVKFILFVLKSELTLF